MNNRLTILIVNYNTSKFIDIVLFALNRLTKCQFEVIICDNGSTEEDISQLISIVAHYTNVSIVFREQTVNGSIGHGEALDLLVEKVKTPYFVTLDSDCSFLQKEWDEILISYLDERNKCIGTPPVPNPIKPTDFPNLFAVLYETMTYRKLSSPSFSPDPSWIQSNNKLNERSRDTGWEVRQKYLENNFQGICLDVKNTRNYKKGPFNNILCAEYYLPGSNKIFACHFGRGASLGGIKYSNYAFINKVPFLGEYITRRRRKRDQMKWIETVRLIVMEEMVSLKKY